MAVKYNAGVPFMCGLFSGIFVGIVMFAGFQGSVKILPTFIAESERLCTVHRGLKYISAGAVTHIVCVDGTDYVVSATK